MSVLSSEAADAITIYSAISADPAPATGFGLRIDRLIEALGIQEETSEADAVIFSKGDGRRPFYSRRKKGREAEKSSCRIWRALKISII